MCNPGCTCTDDLLGLFPVLSTCLLNHPFDVLWQLDLPVQLSASTLQAASPPQATTGPTTCNFTITGSPDGTGVQNAAIQCTGAGTPLPIAGSMDLERFASGFQGVAFSRATADQGAFLQFANIPQVLSISWQAVIILSLLAYSNLQERLRTATQQSSAEQAASLWAFISHRVHSDRT